MSTRTNGRKKTPKTNDLKRAVRKLKDLYEKGLTLHGEKSKSASNRKHRTTSLDYQKTGQRVQDSVPFQSSKVCKSSCPACGHSNTMPIESHDEVNAMNASARAASIDGKFVARSRKVACYCFPQNMCTGDDDGDGCALCEARKEEDPDVDLEKTECKCMCQVTFEEAHRYNIALSLKKNEALEQTKKNGGSMNRPDGTTSSLFCTALAGYMNNSAVQEWQSNDARTDSQRIQDAGTRTVHAILSDPSIVSDPAIQMQLSQQIPRGTKVNYPHRDGKVEQMTLVRARAVVTGGKSTKNGKVSTSGTKSHTPSHMNFIKNKTKPVHNSSNRAHRNSLSHVAMNPSGRPPFYPQLAFDLTNSASASSMSEYGMTPPRSPLMSIRVRKRSNRLAFCPDTSPITRATATEISRRIVEKDPHMLAAIDEDLEPENSQEAYGFAKQMVKPQPVKTAEEHRVY